MQFFSREGVAVTIKNKSCIIANNLLVDVLGEIKMIIGRRNEEDFASSRRSRSDENERTRLPLYYWKFKLHVATVFTDQKQFSD